MLFGETCAVIMEVTSYQTSLSKDKLTYFYRWLLVPRVNLGKTLEICEADFGDPWAAYQAITPTQNAAPFSHFINPRLTRDHLKLINLERIYCVSKINRWKPNRLKALRHAI